MQARKSNRETLSGEVFGFPYLFVRQELIRLPLVSLSAILSCELEPTSFRIAAVTPTYKMADVSDTDGHPTLARTGQVGPLPLELWREIFESVLDSRDLAAASLLCRKFRHEAETVLYRDVKLKSFSQVQEFTDSITSSPKRASEVRRIAFEFIPLLYARAFIDPSAIRSINSLLGSLPLLDTLEFLFSGTAYFPSCDWMSSLVTEPVPFRLRKFVTHLPLGGSLVPFLKSQEDIEVLYFWSRDSNLDKWDFSAEHFPKLRILRAAEGFLPCLQSSWSITHLSTFTFYDNNLFSTLESLSPTLEFLRLQRPQNLCGFPFIKGNGLDFDLPRLSCVEIAPLKCKVRTRSYYILKRNLSFRRWKDCAL